MIIEGCNGWPGPGVGFSGTVMQPQPRCELMRRTGSHKAHDHALLHATAPILLYIRSAWQEIETPDFVDVFGAAWRGHMQMDRRRCSRYLSEQRIAGHVN